MALTHGPWRSTIRPKEDETSEIPEYLWIEVPDLDQSTIRNSFTLLKIRRLQWNSETLVI